MRLCVLLYVLTLLRKEVRKMLPAEKDRGQGMVEYALILILVAIVVIIILAVMASHRNMFSNVVSNI